MSGRIFVDTNVLVYSRDSTDPGKQRQAADWMAELWRNRDGALSFQVLKEFYVTVTRKLNPGMDRKAARDVIDALCAWNPVVTDQAILEEAWRIEDRFTTSWWDSLIVAAAQAASASYLLTEDMQDGMDFEGVIVVNPFATSYTDLRRRQA